MITLTQNFGIATIEPTRAWNGFGADATTNSNVNVTTTSPPSSDPAMPSSSSDVWARYEAMKAQHPYWNAFWGIYRTAAFGVCAYHGYKRRDTVGGAIGWGILGAIFPTITTAVALAQGLSTPKK